MKKDKQFISGIIGFSILVSYWLAGTIFCTIMLIIHWVNYSTIGETLPLPMLIMCTVLLAIIHICTSFSTYIYLNKLIKGIKE